VAVRRVRGFARRYGDMEDFIDTLSDARLAARLCDAIRGAWRLPPVQGLPASHVLAERP
jgi:hypothetical protein